MNTDELGTVRPFQEETANSQESDAEAESSAPLHQEEIKEEEEVKAELATTMINTSVTN